MQTNTISQASKAEILKQSGFTLKLNYDSADIFDEDEFENFENITVWEKPVPFDNIHLPEFPVNELPVTIGDYVRAVAESVQVAPDMAAVASLAALAVCLQGKYVVEGKKDWIEPLNLYFMPVAPSSEFKSVTLKHSFEPVKLYETEENERLKSLIEENRIEKAILMNRKRMLEMKSSKSENCDHADIRELSEELSEFKEIRELRLFCGDVTPEKLVGVMKANNEKAAVISAEGGIFGTLAGRYSSGQANIDIILQGYSGDSVRIDRQNRESIDINNPKLTMLIFAQPRILEEVMANELFRGRGLSARFLYLFPASRVGNRVLASQSIPDVTRESYYTLINMLLKLKAAKDNKPQVIRLSEKAYKVFEGFYHKIEAMLAEELAYMADWGGKIRGAVLRIAGLLHVANKIERAQKITEADSDSLTVCESVMQSAVRIGEYFIEHAKKAYQVVGDNENQKNAEYILKKIIDNRFDNFKKSQIFQFCRKFKSVDELTEPLNLLVKYCYLKESEQEYTGTGRRPEKIYLVNPQIL